MARSKWKLTFFSKNIWNKFFFKKLKFRKKISVLVFKRSSLFPISFLKSYVHIYKGNLVKRLKLRKFFLGHKLGEFAFTKKPFFFPLKKKKR